jgi:hypothetical protein
VNVTFDEEGLALDGQIVPIVAGEFHYWRVNPVYWPKILDRFVEAKMWVSTFVCWDAHEREIGRFDFAGETDPALNLGGFLDLCATRKLYVLIRVGPIIDAFWPTRGPARDVAALERHEDEYKKRTREYLDHLIPVLRDRQATRGGNIVMCCLDNEVYYPYVTTADKDFTPRFGEIEVVYREDCVMSRYRNWLRERYDTIDQMNEACGTSYRAFEEVADPDFRSDTHALTMHAFEHINDSIAEGFTWLRDEVVARGIELPMYCNNRMYTEFIDWGRVDRIIGSAGNQGFSICMVPEAHEHVITWSHMLHRARTKFPWCAEHQAGMCFGTGMDHLYGMLPPRHFRFAGHLITALGERGAALTMYVECDWWHWSPITPVGEVRADFYQAVQDFLETQRRTRSDRRLSDCALIWCPEDHQAYVSSLHEGWLTLQDMVNSVSDPKEWPSWWTTFRTLLDEDWDFDLVVPADGRSGSPPIWFYAGSNAIGLKTLEAIVAHVNQGGFLIVTSTLPELAHTGGAAATERVCRLVEELRANDRVLFAAPHALIDALGRVGARRFSASGVHGCRTYNYISNGERDLWIVNSTDRPQELRVSLDCRIEGVLDELTLNSQLSREENELPRIDDNNLLLSLPAKTVRAFRFPYESQSAAKEGD